MRWLAFVLAVQPLAACADFPRDQAGTLERIRSERVVRVGLAAPARSESYDERLLQLAQRSAAAAGAAPQITQDAAEPLLLKLEEGELDLVLGRFDSYTPWSRRVHMVPSIASEEKGKATIETTAAVRNGENGWIMLVEREARALAGR